MIAYFIFLINIILSYKQFYYNISKIKFLIRINLIYVYTLIFSIYFINHKTHII